MVHEVWEYALTSDSLSVTYCLSKKSWPTLYSKLLHRLGHTVIGIHSNNMKNTLDFSTIENIILEIFSVEIKWNNRNCRIFNECTTVSTVCPRSSDPFYIVSYYIKWVTTSWTYSMSTKIRPIYNTIC